MKQHTCLGTSQLSRIQIRPMTLVCAVCVKVACLDSRLQQVAAAVPCAEALLLLLEVVVMQLCLHQPCTETILRMYDSTTLMISLLTESSPDTGAASPAAAAAAVVLLQAVAQHLPAAVLHAAAVSGCKGLRSAAEEYPSVLGEALHMQYAKLVVQVPIFTGRRECLSAHHGSPASGSRLANALISVTAGKVVAC
jgi:hypothetical protein